MSFYEHTIKWAKINMASANEEGKKHLKELIEVCERLEKKYKSGSVPNIRFIPI